VAARSKAWVCGLSLAGIGGSNPPAAWMSAYCNCYMCCQVEVSAADRSLVERSPTKCDVVEEAKATNGCQAMIQL
jgi:hypothetical protein